MLRTRSLTVLLVLLLVTPLARAEDEPQTVAREVLDMRGYQTEPAPRGPFLALPTDLIAAGAEPDESAVWRQTGPDNWLEFLSPALTMRSVSPETVADILLGTIAHRDALRRGLDLSPLDDRVVMTGSPEALEALRANQRWVLGGVAPSIRLDGVLTRANAGGETRLEAMGGARLWPGRWTRIYLQSDEVACTPMWDIEVAQEATTTEPGSVGVPEGRELYARYHPGETVSLVELWAGDVQHLEVVREDLARLRNVPEANGFGNVSYPRSAVNRTYTQMLVPADRSVRRELRWTNENGMARLALRIGAAPAPTPVLPRGERGSLAMFRAGAVASQLDFGTRPLWTDQWTENISDVLYRAAAVREAEGRADEFSVSPTDGGEIFFLEAPACDLPKARAVLRKAESEMTGRHVHLRVLTAPEAPWRAACIEGTVAVGSVVPEGLLTQLREAGASEGESVHLPVLIGTAQGFRVGRSVPGIIDYDAQVAQQAAGLRPITWARFSGLFGELRVRATAGGHAARVRGAYCWAGRAPRAVELTVRPPVSMQGAKDNAVETDAARSRVSLPILTGGHAPIGREVMLPEGGARDVLVHAHVRGDEVVLLLLSLD